MVPDPKRWPEKFGPYLWVLAELHLRGQAWLRAKISPSDVVQETLIRGLQNVAEFRGTTEEEERGWLRLILTNLIRNAIRDLGTQKRGAGREVSLDGFEQTSTRLQEWLEAKEQSPGGQAQRGEAIQRLGAALSALPECEREAVALYYLHAVPVREIAAVLGKSQHAVGRDIKRALKRLRPLLGEH